jgi:hypothetical protein
MEKVFNNAGFFLLALGFSALISFGFFSAGVTKVQIIDKQHHQDVELLKNQIDSLENIVNQTFKNKKDTIIVEINPQIVKYYHYSK